MDIGMLKSNHVYYDGYEGEGEVVLRIKETKEYYLSIWDGFFEDIFGKPILSNAGWTGFTRDYQEGKDAFGYGDSYIINDIHEYIKDLKNYKGKDFAYDETEDCLDLMIAFFEFAEENFMKIEVSIN